jgi:3-oxoacyl-[acyl-carrier-protein] synthase II
MRTRVVITGMGVVSPVGNGLDRYWDNLCAGKTGIRRVDRFDVSEFTTQMAGLAEPVEPEGVSGKDRRRMDLYTVYALTAAQEAWAQSGLEIGKDDPLRFGCMIGSGIGGIKTLEDNHALFLEKGARRLGPFTIPSLLCNTATGEVAIRYNLQGPNKAVVTACATGAQSIIDAVNSIRLGYADVVVTGGAEAPVTPYSLAGFGAMRAMSRRNDEPERASRPFDKDRDGFVMGEGAGVLIMESEEHAKARGAEILGEFGGGGETCDAYHLVAPKPHGIGAAAAMKNALHDAQVAPGTIGYFNAHGTSTHHNDVAESEALRDVFGDNTPPVSSTKSMTGHLLGAAGAIEAIACVQSIRTGVLPPSINYDTPDPECPVNLVANEARTADVACAMSNSLGFGGHNASLVVKRYEG